MPTILTVLLVSTNPLTVSAGTPRVVHTIPVDESFTKAELVWSANGKGFELRWRTVSLNGKIGICGAVLYPDLSTRIQSENVLRRASVVYEGKRIMRDMRFFSVVPQGAAFLGARSHCATTAIPAPETWTVDLEWSAGRAKF